MATAIQKFDDAKVPTFFRAPAESNTNALAALAPTTFPYLSIKGKRFALVRNKEETTIMRPDDDETPTNAIEAILVNAAPNFSKVFYAEGYTEGSKEKPTCFSNDGIAPDPQSTEKQSVKCMNCEHNAWGTGTNGKGKACSDSLRLAIAFGDSINDPMMLRVPPASLKAATEYAAMLSRKGAPMEGILTKIKFDPEEATPKLQFSALSYVTEEQYKEVLEVAKSNVVQQIIGVQAIPRQASLPAPKETAGEDSPPAKAPKKAEVKVEKAPEERAPIKGSKADKAAKAVKDAPKAGVSALAQRLKDSMKSAAADD